MDGDTKYLEKGFNPQSLKIKELRKIFAYHHIHFNSSAKKADLVNLFKQKITSRAPELLKEYNDAIEEVLPPIKRASRGGSKSTSAETSAEEADVVSNSDDSSGVSEAGPGSDSSNSSDSDSDSSNSSNSSDSDSDSDSESESTSRKRSNTKKSKLQEDSPEIISGDSNSEPDSSFSNNNSFQSDAVKQRKRKLLSDEPEPKQPDRKKQRDLFDYTVSDSESEDFERLLAANLKDSTQILTSPKKKLVAKKGSTEDDEQKSLDKIITDSRLAKKKPKKSRGVEKPSKKAIVNSSSMAGTPSKISKAVTPVISPKAAAPSKSKSATPSKSKSATPSKPKAASPLMSKINSPTAKRSLQSKTDSLARELGINIVKSNVYDANSAPVSFGSRSNTPKKQFKSRSSEPKESSSNASPEPSYPQVIELDHVTEVTPESDGMNSNDIEEFSQSEDEKDSNNAMDRFQKDAKDADRLLVDQTKDTGDDLDLITDDADNTHRSSVFGFIKYFTIFVMASSLFGYGYWFADQRVLVGYCGSSLNKKTIPNPHGNVYIDMVETFLQENLKPKCIPCPENATCYPYFDLSCHDDYLEIRPVTYYLSGKKCIPDLRKQRRIENMVAVSLDILRNRNAAVDCGKGSDEEASISSDEMYDMLLDLKASGISNKEFDEIWQKAEEQIEKMSEVKTTFKQEFNDDSVSETTGIQKKGFRSSSLDNLDIHCRAKKLINFLLLKYRLYITIFTLSILGLSTIGFQIKRIHNKRKEIKKIHDQVIERLKTRSLLAKRDYTGYTKPYLESIVLRDELLGNDSKNKSAKWKAISSVIETNPSVRVEITEIYGEIKRVWEWVGN